MIERFSGIIRTFPIAGAALAQAAAVLILIGVIRLGHFLSLPDLPILMKLMVQALLAGMVSSLLRLPPWWLYIQLFFPFLLAAALVLSLPGWLYPVLFAALALTFWNSAGDRVPLYLSNKDTAAAVLAQIPASSQGQFMDLGCGPAGLLLTLAKARPDWRFIGVEASPALFLLARMRLALSGCNNARLIRENFWNSNTSQADLIYTFLSPAPMPDLFARLSSTMKPGSRLISNSFSVPGHPADEIISLNDQRQTKLHLWHMQ